MVAKALIFIIKIYQKILSPDHSFWARGLDKPPYCKHYPSCSQYAIKSIENSGPIRGSFYAIKRILRCNPWSKGGEDYPPEK